MKVTRINLAAVVSGDPTPSGGRVEVPVPPSANNLYPTGKGGRRFPSAEYKAWREAAYPVIQELAKPAAYPVEVRLTLTGAGVNQGRDVANIEKAITDGLVACGILPNDSLKYVAGNHQLYRADAGEPRVVVEVLPAAGRGDVEYPLELLRFYWRTVSDLRADRAAQRRFTLALADRIHAAHEVLARLAERRAVVISERDSCPLS